MPSSKKNKLNYGEGSLHKRQATGLWVGTFTYTTSDGKQVRKSVSSMSETIAKQKLAKLRQEYVREGDLLSGSPTLGQWLNTWYTRTVLPKNRPKTAAVYKTMIEQYLIPSIGSKRLDALTPAHVRRMHTYIMDEKDLSSTTAQQAHRVLAVALKYAEREGLVRKNVATLTDAPVKAARETVVLTPLDGLNILAAVRGDRLESLTQARLLTGARQGELLGLELTRITNKVDLSWQLQRVPYAHGCGDKCGRKRAAECPDRKFDFPRGHEHRHLQGGLWLTRPKSKSGKRVIPMFEPLASALERRILAAQTEENPHGLLWTSNPDTGAPLDPSRDNAAWHAILERAGAPDARVHDARHLTASMLLAAKVSPTVITRILGHSTYVMSEQYMDVDIRDIELAMTEAMKGLAGPQ